MKSSFGFVFLFLLPLSAAAAPESTVTADDATGFSKRSFINPTGNETFHVLAECHDTDNAYTLLEVEAPPHTALPLHYHAWYDEKMEVVDGVFHTTIQGVNRTYRAGETFVFAQHVHHLWWTSELGAVVRIKIEPCHDGFHEVIEISSKMPSEELKSIWAMAVLYRLSGTLISGGPWYQKPLLWVLGYLAEFQWGLELRDELRKKYVHGATTTPNGGRRTAAYPVADESTSSEL